MRSYLEIELLRSRIHDIPDHIQLIAMQPVCNLQNKRKRKFCQSLVRRLKSVSDLLGCLRYQCKLHITGKPMLTEFEFPSVHTVTLLPNASYNRKEHRRASAPISRVSLPKIFHITLSDALKFRTMFADLDGQYIIS